MASPKAFAYRSVMRPPRLPRSALFATPPVATLIATLSGLISSARIQDFFHDSAYRAVVPSPRRARGPESIISYWRIKPGPLIEIGRTDGLVAIRANLWLHGDTLGGEFEPRNTVVDDNSLPHR